LTAADPFHLERFVTAQAPVFAAVLDELQAGRKRTHWMWFVFPQLRGLGRSSMATFYGIGSLREARAYLAHLVLGPRLELCIRTILGLENGSLHRIFGSPDDMKFQSSMTLFAFAAAEPASVFYQALDRWCDGELDAQTLTLLEAGGRHCRATPATPGHALAAGFGATALSGRRLRQGQRRS
jgi:uncharacterized protein (DUF1810 family)